MMVNCLKCGSRVDNKQTWRTNCINCGNELAVCNECLRKQTIITISCCSNKDYKMMSNS